MVQECYKYVDAVTDLTIKLRLIDTLRTVTAGKVCVSKMTTFSKFFDSLTNMIVRYMKSSLF